MRALLTILTLTVSAVATAGNRIDDQYFDEPIQELTPAQKRAVQIVEKHRDASATPISGPDGSVIFPFGQTRPSLVCAVFDFCDVALEPGEQVQSLSLGDDVRWKLDAAVTGQGSQQVQHVIIKPVDANLETSLAIATSRRTYTLRLRSDRTANMPKVSFHYPENAMAKFAALAAVKEEEKTKNTIPETGEYLGQLSFDYEINGSAPWKPVRVYNDGVKTILEMPPTMGQGEAPVFFALRGDASVFPWGAKAEQVMVNYRVQGNRYIVDSVFEKGILIAGVGGDQMKVTITRGQ